MGRARRPWREDRLEGDKTESRVNNHRVVDELVALDEAAWRQVRRRGECGERLRGG